MGRCNRYSSINNANKFKTRKISLSAGFIISNISYFPNGIQYASSYTIVSLGITKLRNAFDVRS